MVSVIGPDAGICGTVAVIESRSVQCLREMCRGVGFAFRDGCDES